MKKRLFLAVIFTLCFVLSAFMACNTADNTDTANSSSSFGGGSYTAEENALYWIAGRDGMNGYSGAYTIDFVEEYNDEETDHKMVLTESYNANGKYFCVLNEYEKGENNEFSLFDTNIAVIEPVTDNGIAKGRYYSYEIDEDGTPQKRATFVSPNYIDERFLRYPPVKQIEEYGIENGDDLESLTAGIKAYFAEEPEFNEDAVTISFVRNQDDSVTLIINAFVSARVEAESEDEPAYEFEFNAVMSLTAKDGKIIKIVDDLTTSYFYADETMNSTDKSVRTKDIVYDFDEERFSKIDTATEATINDYYAFVSVNVDGMEYAFNYTDTLVGETLTVETLEESIASNIGVFVGNRNNEVMFKIYTDKELTVPFTSMALEKEKYDLYLKFVAPENKAVVVTAFKRNSDEAAHILRIVYLWDLNTRFYPRELFENYKLLTIDGKEVTGYSSFVCAESRVYFVVFEDVYYDKPLEVEHGAIEGWDSNASGHWHECGECRDHTFDFAVHDYVEQDGKNVCSVCGFIEVGAE